MGLEHTEGTLRRKYVRIPLQRVMEYVFSKRWILREPLVGGGLPVIESVDCDVPEDLKACGAQLDRFSDIVVVVESEEYHPVHYGCEMERIDPMFHSTAEGFAVLADTPLEVAIDMVAGMAESEGPWPSVVDLLRKAAAEVRTLRAFNAKMEQESFGDANPATGNRYGTNTGHGHVWARPDGVKARCGGVPFCSECSSDKAFFGGRQTVPIGTVEAMI